MATQPQPQRVKRGMFRFGFDKDTDSVNDARNVLFIVAALVATVTFQAGVTPPGGVWQEDKDGHKAGRAIYSSQKGPFYAFLMCNTLAFSTSILVLVSLTFKFPFFVELWVAIGAMFGTYAAAIYAVVPDESFKFRYLMTIAVAPFGFRILVEACKWLMRGRKST